MPADKVYVKIKTEAKGPLADKAVAAMTKAIEAEIKASGVLTTDKPSDAKAPYWSVECMLVLSADSDGKTLSGKLTGAVLATNATISGATLSGSAPTEITGRDGKPVPDDVQALATALARDVMKKRAVPHMKSTKLQ